MNKIEQLNYILISDGSSDKALLNIIEYCFRKHHGNILFSGERADLERVLPRPKTIEEKIKTAIDYYEPDLIFIHRDAEKTPLGERDEEITKAIDKVQNHSNRKFIRIIPIRMMEAWLLTDEKAIRYASNNPNGKVKLDLPDLKRIEQIPDPKEKLRKLLCDASELKGRHLEKLKSRLNQAIHLVAEYTEDYSRLADLEGFKHFESQIIKLKNYS